MTELFELRPLQITSAQPGTPTPGPTYPNQPSEPGAPTSPGIPEIPVPGTQPPAPGPAQPSA